MIRNLFLWLGLLPATVLAAQNVKRVQLPVTSAIIFTNSAQVNMTGKVILPAGKTCVLVEGITVGMVEGTMQATTSGDAVILSITRVENDKEGIYTRDIQEQIQLIGKLKDSLERNKIQLEVLKNEKELLLSNRQVGGTEGVKAVELKQLADFVVTRLSGISEKLYTYQKEVSRLENREKEMQRELENKRNRQAQIAAGVRLLIESPKTQTITLSLSYIVNQAGWYPAYDLRLEEEGGEARMISRAKVWQNTGMDWMNVMLVLSSGNPRAVRQVPVIYPYYLRNEPQQAYVQNTMNLASQRALNKIMPAGTVDAGEVQEEDVTDVNILSLADQSESMNQVDYTIKVPYNITSGTGGSEVQIAGFNIPVTYEYIVVPRISQEALLVAGITDFSKYNLIDGEVSLYLGNSYRGTQLINRNAVSPINDLLSLSMGADKGIVVKRIPKQNFRKESGGTIKVQKLWETTLRNNKSVPVKIKVEDQYPLSQEDKIKVEDLTYTTGNVTVDTDTGKLTWNLIIQPKESISLNVGYTVRYPKGWEVNVR